VLQTALTHRPHAHALHNNLGVVLHRKGELDAARAAFEAALVVEPANPEYLSNAGLTLAALGDLPGAIAAYRRAIAQAADYADAHWNLSLALLLTGQYLEGWREYQWGLRKKTPRATPRHFTRPAWDDPRCAGQRILLYAEQGFGDTIQFVRYASDIAARGGRVIVQCQPGLRRLLSHVPGVEQLIEDGEGLPEFDRHASLFDAPRVLRTEVASIPSSCGYIGAEEARIERWRERLAGLRGLKVGLVWQGRATHAHDALRSIPLRLFEPLLEMEGISFVSLQKGHGSEQIADTAFAGRMLDDSAMWDADGDGIFLDTAAVIANLDLIISIDSAVAHLAGAIGRPVWTLLMHVPDFRWLLDRDDSPWYPSMRLFRQTAHRDWPGAIERVKVALASLVAN
jgi:tetratricopeptide (TPR) repeat protein